MEASKPSPQELVDELDRFICEEMLNVSVASKTSVTGELKASKAELAEAAFEIERFIREKTPEEHVVRKLEKAKAELMKVAEGLNVTAEELSNGKEKEAKGTRSKPGKKHEQRTQGA